ncbi:unnamed protein product [Gongylonema pulchrum]|uniref:NR LBD domain-containing protein n=1 Tax=Gongylonema pulchrum TaxID=637853 RepID=A0A183ESP3_9BILA|nr:unnamed protein product [Gongylonema pulchrum]
MEPDAIRPDRDKTGRQKNPRRSGSESSPAKMTAGSVSSELPCVTSEKDCDTSEGARTSMQSENTSGCGSDLKAAPPVGDESILGTLCEIDDICNKLNDSHPVIPCASIALTDAVLRPALVATRSPLIFDGSLGPAGCKEFFGNLRRLIVWIFDYANTLKPIADLTPSEKVTFLLSAVYSVLHKNSQSLCF